jgi:hypothetical protein
MPVRNAGGQSPISGYKIESFDGVPTELFFLCDADAKLNGGLGLLCVAPMLQRYERWRDRAWRMLWCCTAIIGMAGRLFIGQYKNTRSAPPASS